MSEAKQTTGPAPKPIYLALAGNPNSGKTTVFNAVTGARHHVGNYPGVTVERKEGETAHKGIPLKVVDLPGTYSLTAYSPDERVARQVLIQEKPDVVVHVVDAGNLERNLYLAVQLLAMKVPLVIAFNMMDEVSRRGIRIDVDHLASLLGVPIIPTVGSRGEGVPELLDRAIEVARTRRLPSVDIKFGGELDRAIEKIRLELERHPSPLPHHPGWLAIKLLENDEEARGWVAEAGAQNAIAVARVERERIIGLLKDDPEILLADARYGFVHGAVAESVTLTVEERRSLTDKVDTVVANRVLGLPIFFFFMWATFYVTFKAGAPLTALIEFAFSRLGVLAAHVIPPGMVQSLVVDGIIAGVGGVMVFLPNIMLLFMMVSIMEDSGYMARAAFIIDRVMHLVGLHGKSFIPLFLGFGCNVPAIMGTRILENEKDRRATIMVSPFISCSARLPVYVLLTGAFFPPSEAGNVIFSLYILGILVAMLAARVLRVHLIKGEPTPFVMELPPYRMPTLKSVAIHMWERALMYMRKAGTIILAMSVLMWFASEFPRSEPNPSIPNSQAAMEAMDHSYAGQLGHLIAPALEPVGLGDWKVSIALVSGLVAKEVVVSTMSTIYNIGDEGKPGALLEAVKKDPFFTPLRAYVMMVFVLLYTPCLATIAVAWRELNSWKWAALMLGMNLSVAYAVSAAVFWAGTFLGFK